MAPGSRSVRVAFFGPFRFDLISRDLRKHGIDLRLEEKPALVLQRLIENAGGVVSRKELQELLWPAGVHVDFNHGLNKALNRLRGVLGDDREQPRYIETLSRRGYRFIAQVELVTESPIASLRELDKSSEEPANVAVDAEIAQYPVQVSLSAPLEKMASNDNSVLPNMWFGTSSWRALSVAVAAIVIIGFVLRVAQANRPAGPGPARAVIKLPAELRLTTTSENLGLAISPDGTQVVFSAVGRSGQPQLWLRRLDASQPVAIPGTEGGSFPFWSPDQKNLGFFAESALKRVSLADHSVRTLCAIETARGGSWSQDGVILFSAGTRGPIYKVGGNGGVPSVVTTLDETHYTTHRWPTFLADGKHFVYLAANHEKSWAPGAVFLGSLEGGPAKLLGESDSNAVPVSGSLLFLSHGKLISQVLDLEKGILDPHASILAEAVSYDSGSWYGSFTASAAGLVYRPRMEKGESNALTWFDRKGNKLGEAGPPGIYQEVSLAANGKTIAATCGDPQRNVCLIHADATITQITHDGINGVPAWVNNSSSLSYFTHSGSTSCAITIKPIDEGTPGHMFRTGLTCPAITSWHPDRTHALVIRNTDKGQYQYFIFDLATGKTIPYLSLDSPPIDYARFSPDGKWIAYSKRVEGKRQLHIISYPVPSADYKVNAAEGRSPQWRRDSRELFFLGPGSNLCAVALAETNAGLDVGTPQVLFHPAIPPAPWDVGSYDVTGDGTRFLVNTVAGVEPSELVVTTNWRR